MKHLGHLMTYDHIFLRKKMIKNKLIIINFGISFGYSLCSHMRLDWWVVYTTKLLEMKFTCVWSCRSFGLQLLECNVHDYDAFHNGELEMSRPHEANHSNFSIGSHATMGHIEWILRINQSLHSSSLAHSTITKPMFTSGC